MIYNLTMVFLVLQRLLLGSIFLSSALPKLRHPRIFASIIQAYYLLPKTWLRPLAHTLPWLELVLGLMLLLGWQTRFAALASGTLLLLFLIAMSINLARGRKDLDCGCSGKKHAQKIGWKTIVRNVGLILLALPIAVWGGGFLALDNQSPTLQTFILETLLLHTLFPLALSVGGLWLLSRLLRQTFRLVMLTLAEDQPVKTLKNYRNFQPVEVQ